MAKKIRTLVALASLPLLLAAGSASAARPTVPYAFTSACMIELQEVAAVITVAEFKGRNATANRDGLLSKVYGADQKVYQLKPLEAEGLLYQIADKAASLANEGKLAETGAAAIVTAATLPQPAMTCVMAQ